MRRHYSIALFSLSEKSLCLSICLFIIACFVKFVIATDIEGDDAATAESEEQAYSRYTDRIRAYVNITYIDPLTGLKKSEKSLKGKWGTNGRMEQVTGPAMVGKYSGNQTDGCHKLDPPNPSPFVSWIAIIERGQCRFSGEFHDQGDDLRK
jgi:hypothetical protein